MATADEKIRVFLSHKSADKPLLGNLARALIEKDFLLFIDKPLSMGFTADECETFGIRSIRGGKAWNAELKSALRDCPVVLGCMSKSALEAKEVFAQEINYADIEEKLVCCAIDDVRLGELPERGLADLSKFQANRIHLDRLYDAYGTLSGDGVRQLDHLIKDIRESGTATPGRDRANPQVRPPDAIAAPVPREAAPEARKLSLEDHINGLNRVDRDADRLRLVQEAAQVIQSGGVRPFTVLAPETEMVDNFVWGVRDELRDQPAAVEADLRILEVRRAVYATQARDFEAQCALAVADALDLPSSSAHITEIAETLQQARQMTILVFQRVDVEANDADTIEFLRLWTDFWKRFEALGRELRVMPILKIQLHGAPAGWQTSHPFRPFCPPSADQPAERQSWWGRFQRRAPRSGAKSLQCPNLGICEHVFGPVEGEANPPPSGATSILTPVRKGAAEDWQERLGLNFAHAVKDTLGQLFDAQTRNGPGVTMVDFHGRMTTVLATYSTKTAGNA